MPRRGQRINLVGKRFGRLVVLEFVENRSLYYSYWLCACDCGNTHVATGGNLKARRVRSCGCISQEVHTTHGQAKRNGHSKLYRAWCTMKGRCYNPTDQGYPNYGARGIRVCDRWKNSFEKFAKDVGEPPSAKHSIDRINNDGNYVPRNCRWATWKEQANNTRKNNRHTPTRETRTEYAERTGIRFGTVKRIAKSRQERSKQGNKVFWRTTWS